MGWVPLITFVQIMIDAMNAMRVVPGQFKSFGHDYRADTANFVHAAYHLPDVTDEQKKAVGDTLRQLELERGERIKNAVQQAGTDGIPKKRTKRPPYLRDRTPMDPDEAAIGITPGDVPAEFQ